MSKEFLQALKNRRSIYAINNESPISDSEITSIVTEALQHVPSAFNSQSQRVVVLFGENHKKLWNITLETLRKIVPAESFSDTEGKMSAFAAGHGSVLFFDDSKVTNGFAEQFPLYAENFKVWAEHSIGMLQLAVWAALESEGLGASLQHYNPLIDEEVKSAFKIPSSWRLIAQMPFGKAVAPAGEKQFVPIEDRLIVL